MLGPLLVDLAMEFRTSVLEKGELATATAATLVRYKGQEVAMKKAFRKALVISL